MTKRTYKACKYRNTEDAYGRFRSSNAASRAYETVVASMHHKITGGIIALMSALGVIGWWMTFGPLA